MGVFSHASISWIVVAVRPGARRQPHARPSCSLWNGVQSAILASMNASENGVESAIIPAQVRAARALVGLTREQLAAASAVPIRTLDRLENGHGSPQRRTLAAIRTALEAAGVTFTNGDEPGVKLKRQPE